ncbi:MAG: aspartate kinase [Acidobacteriota bacterium]
MIVMKFGGTSVEDAASIERVAEIIRARIALRPVVVVSAMGKTTRKLLQSAEASAAGNRNARAEVLDDLKNAHLNEAIQLVTDSNSVFQIIDDYFDELSTLLEGLAILGEVPPRGLDKILSYGELLSSAIVAAALAERGLAAQRMDSRQFIITNDRYGAASPIFEITDQKIVEILRPALDRNQVPVIQGFIGSTREGATTTLGFEGSDFTAAIVGAALDAADIQIWKDVSGLMTADPALYSEARTVKVCSYSEAAELTFFGAKVLHPKAVHPAAQKNIPVHIFNSRQPQATGTEIKAAAPSCSNLIKSIAYTRPVTLLQIQSGVGAEGVRASSASDFMRSIINALNRQRIVPLVMAVSATSVALAIGQVGESAVRDLIEEISRVASVERHPHKAIVSMVGEELKTDPAFASLAFRAIDSVKPQLILHGSSPIAINLVVAESDTESVIAALHRAFFAELDPQVFV